jgi:hypothetical protein
MDEKRIYKATMAFDFPKIIKSGKLFEDPDFKPTQNCLFNKLESKLDEKTKKLWKTFEWKRWDEIYPDGFEVFDDDKISYQDLKQGLLGTWYMWSAVVSAISNLERISDIFITKKANQSGIYVVRFIINGQPKLVAIDDHFVVNPATDLPAFSYSTKNLIWPLILEKAWAKLNGNFENIVQGYPQDFLSFLMPGPSLYINLKHGEYTENQLWKMLVRGYGNNHIICAISHTVKTCPNLK